MSSMYNSEIINLTAELGKELSDQKSTDTITSNIQSETSNATTNIKSSFDFDMMSEGLW